MNQSTTQTPLSPVRTGSSSRVIRLLTAIGVAILINLGILVMLVVLTDWQEETELGRRAVRMVTLSQPEPERESSPPPPLSDPSPPERPELETPPLPPVTPEVAMDAEPLPMLDLAMPELGVSAVNVRITPPAPRPSESRPAVTAPSLIQPTQTEPAPTAPSVAPVEPARPLALARGPSELPGNAPPQYPRFALRQGVEGVAHLKLLIGTDGRVRDAQIERVEGPAAFGEAARSAAMNWRFRPARDVEGNAVEVWATKPVRFEINR